MAGRGPAPKPAEQRRRRNIDPIAESKITDDGQRLGPDLNKLTGRSDWLPQVIAWFETWRTSPQAKVFVATDWQRLGMLAPLVQEYLAEPRSTILSEIRLNEERLGATVVDRQRARMVVEPSSKDTAPVIALASAKDRIAKRTSKQ